MLNTVIETDISLVFWSIIENKRSIFLKKYRFYDCFSVVYFKTFLNIRKKIKSFSKILLKNYFQN